MKSRQMDARTTELFQIQIILTSIADLGERKGQRV